MDRHPNKVIIRSFSDKELKNEAGEFVLPVNPEQYAQTFKVKYEAKVAPGSQSVEERFLSSGPEELKLDFIFDGTNTVYGYAQEGKTVTEQIEAFKNVVYSLDGPIHQPKYLKVQWTKFIFDCILTELQITYTLFDPEGLPLRAKLSCSFLNYKETARKVQEEGKSSPDLTHRRGVAQSDTLPLMVNKIYGNPNLYLEVARVNNLTNFRRLSVGDDLVFPPVKKTSS